MLVANLAKQPGYPADFVAAYTANIVSKEDNVKAVVAKIELGEGDAGDRLRHRRQGSTEGHDPRRSADAANVPATYGGVVVKASPNQAAATAFITWLAGPDGQAILESFGFLPPVVTEGAAGRHAPRAPRGPGMHDADRRGRQPLRRRGLLALFLGLPVVVLVVRSVARRVAGERGRATPVVLDALG